MAIYKRDIVDINLETGNIHRSFLKHSIGYLDQQADRFGIRTYRDGAPVDLSGVSVQGIFMPPQGSPISITGVQYTAVSGNEAIVVLPQACYNYDGQFTLAIKLVDSTNAITGTMRIIDGMVDNTHASGTVAPTGSVPTYQEILATYDAMVAATAATNASLANYYSDLPSSIPAGTYCIYNHVLYRCIATIASKGEWDSSYWTPVKLGDDVHDLRSDVNDSFADYYSDLPSSIQVGTYCIYNNILYRCISPIASKGAWDATKWEEAKLANDTADIANEVSDVKSATDYNDYLIQETFSPSFTLSAAITAEDGTNGTVGCRTSYLDYTKPMKISFNKPGEKFVVWTYSDSSTSYAVSSPTKRYVSGTVYLPLITTTKKKIRIGFHKDNGGTYTSEEAAASFAAVKFYSQTDKTLLLDNVPADAKKTGEKTTANRNDIDNIIARMGRENLFNYNDADVVEGQFISGLSDGEEVWTINTRYGESGYIPVENGDKITFFYAGGTGVANLYRVYYNSSKEPLLGGGSMPSNNYLTIDSSSIKYIRVVFNLSIKTRFMVIKVTDQDTTPYSPEGEVYVPYPNLTLPYIIKSTDDKIGRSDIGGQWKGKSWYAYGTSITANNGAPGRNTYVKYLADMSGMIATNKGIGGQGIGIWGSSGNHGEVFDAICNTTDGKLNADLITLETVANDIGSTDTPLGTVYDTGTDTLAGRLTTCLRYLQANTDAQVAVIVSPVSTGLTVTDLTRHYFTWAKMVEEICRINRVHFINNDNNMGKAKISDSTKGSLYVRDNIHETDLGSYIMAQNIWYQLRNIPLFYSEMPE